MVDSKENYNFDVGVKGLMQGDRLMQLNTGLTVPIFRM